MATAMRNKSGSQEKAITTSTTDTDTNTAQPRRPDLTRIQTDTAPSLQTGIRRDSDQLLYSGSTHSAKSTKTSQPEPAPAAAPSKERNFSIPGLVISKSMSKFALLPPTEEDELHAKRLLNIEEKPFKRIQKRLLAPSNPFQEYLRRTPVDAPSNTRGNGEVVSDEDTADTNGTTVTATEQPKTQEEADVYLKQLETFSHQTLHDFSALTTSLARLQFLLTSNEKERERYANQVNSITEQHGTIRTNTSELRTRLSEARDQLAVRKTYDTLAEKVLWVDGKVGGEKAKTREELGRESEKLKAEIEELEREGSELKGQWTDRREALQSVIDEAGRLRRVVRGEPEHVEEEKREEEDGRSEIDGEDDEQKRREDEDEGMLGASDRDREGGSTVGTPRPLDDGGATPMPEARESGAMTPLPTTQESGGRTPRSTAGDVEAGGFTPRPATAEGGSALKNETQAGDDDVDMASLSEQHSLDVPEVKVDDAEKAEVDEMETT